MTTILDSTSMHRFVNKMAKAASGRNVLIFLIPSLAIYLVMFLHTIPGVQSYAPETKIFDLLPGGYSYDYAIKLFSTLGDEGRKEYLNTQLPLDFIYPALFSISSFLLLAWLFVKRYDKGSRIFYFCFVPIFAGMFDYLENLQIVIMILSFPDISNIQVVLSSHIYYSKKRTNNYFLLNTYLCHYQTMASLKVPKKYNNMKTASKTLVQTQLRYASFSLLWCYRLSLQAISCRSRVIENEHRFFSKRFRPLSESCILFAAFRGFSV